MEIAATAASGNATPGLQAYRVASQHRHEHCVCTMTAMRAMLVLEAIDRRWVMLTPSSRVAYICKGPL